MFYRLSFGWLEEGWIKNERQAIFNTLNFHLALFCISPCFCISFLHFSQRGFGDERRVWPFPPRISQQPPLYRLNPAVFCNDHFFGREIVPDFLDPPTYFGVNCSWYLFFRVYWFPVVFLPSISQHPPLYRLAHPNCLLIWPKIELNSHLTLSSFFFYQSSTRSSCLVQPTWPKSAKSYLKVPEVPTVPKLALEYRH